MELARPFAMSQPAISKHLKVLERAGLISRGREGQRRPCRIEPPPTDWGGSLPDGVKVGDVWGFDAAGKPREWPLRYGFCLWSVTLTGLKAGAYELRVRTVDQNGFAQPQPVFGLCVVKPRVSALPASTTSYHSAGYAVSSPAAVTTFRRSYRCVPLTATLMSAAPSPHVSKQRLPHPGYPMPAQPEKAAAAMTAMTTMTTRMRRG